ncbi:hypothetical protein Q1W71_16660 [Flavobacterium pectinovorum]|uniref:hypothetical protein n=1 Tax=Flavobacterium pectinovorum TaxID=29533 RepID=UPI00265F8A14|nr:hypothetical protein [Flavobacterium pectinovorum]WKL46587.1 hypothetical protein Q1W71_16660 [Flavobacterium pectinovorum]
MSNPINNNFEDQGTSTELSKFDKFFGQHFKSLVVGILIIILIISFTVIYCFKSTTNSEVVTLFSSAIMGLIGYFAGSQSK